MFYPHIDTLPGKLKNKTCKKYLITQGCQLALKWEAHLCWIWEVQFSFAGKYEIRLVEYELILNIHRACWGTFIPVICIIRLTNLPLIQIPFSAALYNIRSPNKILT